MDAISEHKGWHQAGKPNPEFVLQRKRLIDQYGIPPRNIDFSRISRYMSDLGLSMTDVLYIPRARISEEPLLASFVAAGFISPSFITDANSLGCNLPAINLVAVKLQNDSTYVFNDAVLERTIVHELIHGSSKWPLIENEQGELHSFRTGHLIPGGRGTFLEEGICEYLAREYMRLHRSDYHRAFIQKMIEEGKLKINSVDGGNQFHDRMTEGILDLQFAANGEEYSMALKNLDYFIGHKLGIIPSAIASQGLEILFGIDDRLLPAMIEARTSVIGLRKVAKILEEIEKGLYIRLMAPAEVGKAYGGLISSPTHFIECLNYIVALKARVQKTTSD